jgi:hypothetical protein
LIARKDWIQAHPSGEKVFVSDPHPSCFDIVDQAHHLSLQCRYAGGVDRFYSVAEHSCHVLELMNRVIDGDPALPRLHLGLDTSHWVLRDLRRWALVHDNSEAYLGDVTRPLKGQPDMVGYKRVEAVMQQRLSAWLGITPLEPGIVKVLDAFILGTEARRMKNPIHPDWHHTCAGGQMAPDVFPPERPWTPWRRWGWSPEKAKREYLARFVELFGPVKHFRAGGR